MRYDVYGIGNALVDFLIFVDDDYLRSRSIAKGAMTLVAEPVADIMAGAAAGDAIMRSGGSAANTIVALVATGGSGCFSGKIGADALGDFYCQDLEKLGLAFYGDRSPLPTGSCTALVTPDGERSMLTHLGASTSLSSDDIDEEAIKNSSYVYLEGYLWDAATARRAALAAMEIARRNGTKVAFSFSDPCLVERFRDDFLRLAEEYVDLLFCNDQEARRITGVDVVAPASAELGNRVEQVCVTLGARGAFVVNQGVVRRTPALSVPRVVDTTGAGDLYAAGVLRALTLNFDLISASLVGARLAAAIVETVGARLSPEALQR